MLNLGYNNRVAIINLSYASVEYRDLQEERIEKFIVGHGLGVSLLEEYDRPSVGSRSDSTICLMTGPLTATGFPMANRLTIVFKSPLTGTIAWINIGGYDASSLKQVGLDGVIIQGRSETPAYMLINSSQVTIHEAAKVWGAGCNRECKLAKATAQRCSCIGNWACW